MRHTGNPWHRQASNSLSTLPSLSRARVVSSPPPYSTVSYAYRAQASGPTMPVVLVESCDVEEVVPRPHFLKAPFQSRGFAKSRPGHRYRFERLSALSHTARERHSRESLAGQYPSSSRG